MGWLRPAQSSGEVSRAGRARNIHLTAGGVDGKRRGVFTCRTNAIRATQICGLRVRRETGIEAADKGIRTAEKCTGRLRPASGTGEGGRASGARHVHLAAGGVYGKGVGGITTRAAQICGLREYGEAGVEAADEGIVRERTTSMGWLRPASGTGESGRCGLLPATYTSPLVG